MLFLFTAFFFLTKKIISPRKRKPERHTLSDYNRNFFLSVFCYYTQININKNHTPYTL